MPRYGVSLIADGRPTDGVNQLIAPGSPSSNSPGTLALVANRLYYNPIKVITPIILDNLYVEVTAGGGALKKARLGIYRADLNWQPQTLIGSTAELDISAIAVVSGAFVYTLQPGRYLTALHTDGTPTVRIINNIEPFKGCKATLGADFGARFLYKASAYAALADPGTAWDTVQDGYSTLFIFCGVATL